MQVEQIWGNIFLNPEVVCTFYDFYCRITLVFTPLASFHTR